MYVYTVIILILAHGNILPKMTKSSIPDAEQYSKMAEIRKVSAANYPGDIISPSNNHFALFFSQIRHDNSSIGWIKKIDMGKLLHSSVDNVLPSELNLSFSPSQKILMLKNTLNLAFEDWKGTPYLYGGNTSNGIDCSAFIQRVFSEYLDVQIPRTTTQQIEKGLKISKDNLKTGDLVFFKTSPVHFHVGVIIKGDRFIHASSSEGVTISSLNNGYWIQKFIDGRRILQVPG